MKFVESSIAAEVAERLRALTAQVEQIQDLHVGLDVVGSEVSWHLVLTTTHASLEDLQAYQAHPVHKEFGAWVRPLLAERAVVDHEDAGPLR